MMKTLAVVDVLGHIKSQNTQNTFFRKAPDKSSSARSSISSSPLSSARSSFGTEGPITLSSFFAPGTVAPSNKFLAENKARFNGALETSPIENNEEVDFSKIVPAKSFS